MSSSTVTGAPPPAPEYDFDTCRNSMSIAASSVELELAFGKIIESAPKNAVDDDDEERHHHDAEIDRWLIAFLGHLRNVGTQAIGNEFVVAPRGDLRDDAGVPCSARRRNGARHPERKYRRNDQRFPEAPAVQAEHRGGFAQVGRDRHRAGDDVEQDVPLRAE